MVRNPLNTSEQASSCHWAVLCFSELHPLNLTKWSFYAIRFLHYHYYSRTIAVYRVRTQPSHIFISAIPKQLQVPYNIVQKLRPERPKHLISPEFHKHHKRLNEPPRSRALERDCWVLEYFLALLQCRSGHASFLAYGMMEVLRRRISIRSSSFWPVWSHWRSHSTPHLRILLPL